MVLLSKIGIRVKVEIVRVCGPNSCWAGAVWACRPNGSDPF